MLCSQHGPMVATQLFFSLVATSLALQVTPHTLYITPDNHHSTNNSNTFTLSQCLSDSEMCFNSDSQLLFLTGLYDLQEDFILQNINNITIDGNHSTIKCAQTNSSVGIVIFNVTNIVVQNMEIIYCKNNYSNALANTVSVPTYVDMPKLHWNAAVHIHFCMSITVTNLSITVTAGINGLIVVNSMMESALNNVLVMSHVVPMHSHNANTLASNGMFVYYYQSNKAVKTTLYIHNFTYRSEVLEMIEDKYIFCIILLPTRYTIVVNLLNGEYEDLWNVTVLYYLSYRDHVNPGHHYVSIDNCEIHNNDGNSFKKLIFAKIYNCHQSYKMESHLMIYNSRFYNNVNMNEIISLNTNVPCITQYLTFTRIQNCSFHNNNVMNIIANNGDFLNGQSRWSIYIIIEDTNISSNMCNEGTSLMILNTAQIKCKNVRITNNSFYISILYFYLSVFRIEDNVDIFNNKVRNVLHSMEGSYVLFYPNTDLRITDNIVYSVLTKEMIHKVKPSDICYFQFFADKQLIIENKTVPFKITIINNLYTAPMHFVDITAHISTCKWIDNYNEGFTDYLYTPRYVYSRVINMTTQAIGRNNIGIIPSSICKCSHTYDYECVSHEFGQTFPGQSLIVNLIVPRLHISLRRTVTLMVETAHLPKNGCIITRATEMTQTHSTTGCNQYNYTVWSDKTECELYLSAEGIPEIFYVKLLPCPVGFSLQSHLQGCHCNPVLDSDVISVTTCRLADGTILRPAMSWISADTVNGSHRYYVSSQCPFDYCLPYSSYLNLSTPDMQCQFNRSGVLCGHCQEGLSAVFGSSQCKKCSNIYLFIIIPIAIAGIVLVMMLFVLKLTVTNGTISTFIFYVNIVNTNYSSLLPNCHSPICILLSIFNLDLGIETCFYNNMSDYSKTCLQLVFPFYLIMIALALILSSRYSSKVQRLTAQKGLHVLATLFLLSYTKILSMVCHVLFLYTQTTHLPSRHTELFWSVDTSVELFGIKFTILFIVCLLILLALLSFNILLLFRSSLSRFKVVNTFKPLLDPYLGPYKNKYLYWTGLQLLLRSIFFSLSALDNRISLITGTIAVGILLCMQGILHPFKSWFNNVQESLFLLNLLLVYIFAS